MPGPCGPVFCSGGRELQPHAPGINGPSRVVIGRTDDEAVRPGLVRRGRQAHAHRRGEIRTGCDEGGGRGERRRRRQRAEQRGRGERASRERQLTRARPAQRSQVGRRDREAAPVVRGGKQHDAERQCDLCQQRDTVRCGDEIGPSRNFAKRADDTGGRDRENGLDDEAVDGEQRQDCIVVVAVVVEPRDPGRIGWAGVGEANRRDNDGEQE